MSTLSTILAFSLNISNIEPRSLASIVIWSDLFIKHSSDYVCQQQIYYLYATFVLLKECRGGGSKERLTITIKGFINQI